MVQTRDAKMVESLVLLSVVMMADRKVDSTVDLKVKLKADSKDRKTVGRLVHLTASMMVVAMVALLVVKLV